MSELMLDRRLRGLIVILWRAGLRIQEALSLTEADLDHRRGVARPQRQGPTTPRGRHGRMGLGGASPVARAASPASGRTAVLRHQPTHARPALGQCGRPSRAAPDRRRGRRSSALRAAPASARARRRARSRRRAADRHPAPARPQQPRHHLDLLQGHRQQRDHRNRACPPCADDPSQRIAPTLIEGRSPAPLAQKR
jgi:hypothetical protein